VIRLGSDLPCIGIFLLLDSEYAKALEQPEYFLSCAEVMGKATVYFIVRTDKGMGSTSAPSPKCLFLVELNVITRKPPGHMTRRIPRRVVTIVAR
jgi:hypothetical protein